MINNYKLFLSLMICFTSIVFVKAQSVSQKINFDDGWKFYQGDNEEGADVKLDDSNWRSLVLPHDWSIGGTLNPKNPMGNDGGYFPAGIGWYRKTFTVSKENVDRLIGIYFEGVYMNAEVFINGHSLGVRPYGYSSFAHDLTPYIKIGATNILAVKVDNSQQKNSRWYTGSGIYRHVWLTSTPTIHFEQWSGFIRSTAVSRKSARLELSSVIKNNNAFAGSLDVKTVITDENNKEVSRKNSKLMLAKNSSSDIHHELYVDNPKLWSPTIPSMYTATVTISKNDVILDHIKIPFGIRSISFDVDRGFVLNGEPLKINGGCVHHDNGALGAAAHDKAEYRKVQLMKEAGFNAVRTSHNPPSETFLNACDELGLLVVDESFDGWRAEKNKFDYAMLFDEWWQKDVTSMVLRDRNHPSIIMWSTGNEIMEKKEDSAVRTAQDLVNLVKSLDPSRPVTSAITTWDSEWEMFDPLFAVHDIGSYNYQLHRAASDHQRVPKRIIMQSESYPRDAFQNWKIVSETEYVIGDFVWTAMDYIGESGIGRYFYKGETEGQHYDRDIYPWHGAYCGDIDLLGHRKPISHYRDMLYNEDKKLYLAVKEPSGYYGEIMETMWSVWPTWESWSWPGHEGKSIEVEVYSRYEQIKLYLNGHLVGEKNAEDIKEFKAVFTIPYHKGELKVVGLNDGVERESSILKSAGKSSMISLSTDSSFMKSDGSDICFIDVTIMDQNDLLNPNADNEIEFEIEGPAEIIAVSNANLQDSDPYVGSKRKAWKGRAQVVLRNTGTSGKVSLKASSPGLESAEVILQAR